MINLNIIVEGSTEESFVKDVIKPYLLSFEIYVFARKILTGWDRIGSKPAKGGLLKYTWLKDDILMWIKSDKNRPNTFYTTFVDLYAFPVDDKSPYTYQIKSIIDPYLKIQSLEEAIAQDINHPNFIPYVQLHEFEAFLMVDPDRLLTMYPDGRNAVQMLKENIGTKSPETINESQHTAPSKRIIKFFPGYEGEKAQVGPLVAEDIGLTLLREKCPHFDQWMTKIERIGKVL